LAASKTDGQTKLDAAKAKLDKAEQNITDLADNKWTVLTREDHYASRTYKNSVEQMAAIAGLFPVFFFMVAALVCLTTMTRMIDEERGQIGIQRALGYTRTQCAAKYLFYAASATLIGSIAGSIVGILLFPIVVYQAWNLVFVLPQFHLYSAWDTDPDCFRSLYGSHACNNSYYRLERYEGSSFPASQTEVSETWKIKLY
jgi:putative ABC transport system permease protein